MFQGGLASEEVVAVTDEGGKDEVVCRDEVGLGVVVIVTEEVGKDEVVGLDEVVLGVVEGGVVKEGFAKEEDTEEVSNCEVVVHVDREEEGVNEPAGHHRAG